MRCLINWFNILIKKRKELKRWQRIVTVLAAVITFATTYALILPAITVEKDNTGEVAGMYLEKTANLDVLQEENALEPIGVSIAADMHNAVTFAYSDEDMTATAVFSTDEEIPEGTELVVNLVAPESEEYADLRSRSVDLLDKEFIYDVTTCSFYDYALICDNVDVTPKTGLVDIHIVFRNNTVEHVNDMLFAGRFTRPQEEVDGFTTVAADVFSPQDTSVAGNENAASEDSSNIEDELVSANSDDSSVIELADGIITSLALKGNDLARNDSIVGILAGNVDEETKAAAAETAAEIPDNDGTQEESEASGSAETDDEEISTALPVKTLKASGSDYTVTLSYDESSGIPDEAVLDVSEIAQDSEEYQTYLKEAKKAMGLKEEETLPSFAARFFDIKIMVDGQEFTPDSGVSVEITYAEPLAEYSDTEVNAVHFADEKAEAEVIEANTAEVQDDGKATVEFTAESFSVYGVIYTVDFHWEVNGKTYDFSIPGGGFVSLEHLVEVLGIAASDENTDNVDVNSENGAEKADEFTGEEPSVEEDGKNGTAYEETIKLNQVEVSEATKKFVADVVSVEFSSPELVWVGNADEVTTVGGLKEANGLDIKYSADLTEEQIAEINAQTVEAGDWALISVRAFTSEESLTVTMKNGDQFVVKVTDAQEITSSEATEIDINKAYIICYDDGSNYHILHNDGSQQQVSKSTFDIMAEYYASNTTWAFQHVFKEYDREGTEGYNYYLIRSNDNISNTLALYEAVTQGEDLIQSSNNNVAVLPAEGGGFYLSGYNGYRLAFENGKFVSKKYNEGDPDTGSVMHIFERETLPQYMLTVRSNDPSKGVVWCYSPSSVDSSDILYGSANILDGHRTTEYYKRFDVLSNSPSTGTTRYIDQNIYALYYGEEGLNGTHKYKFDHWELNGEHLDPEEYPWRIPANTLPVPYNGSNLVAHFVYDNTFQARDDQKTDSNVADMSSWLSDFQARRVPLDESATHKTAEVYDYENRIYRVDLTTKSNLRTFNGNIDLGFSLDVSNSMLFPADLKPYSNLSSVSLRNANSQNLGLDTSKTYYIISDAKNRSTVFKIFYKNGKWRYTDASKSEENEIKSNTTFHAVADGNYDNNYTYQMYYANPDSTGVIRDRFYYLNQSLTSITTDLVNIQNTLRIAGANSPKVKVGYNTFNGNVTNDRRTLSDVATITPHFENVRGGGTRPDRAINDAKSLGWTGNTRYLILITDGAPQGGAGTGQAEESPATIRGYVRQQAEQIKAATGQNVKIITIGLSMKDVEEGRKLLYDIADYAPNNGPKMFYLAEKTQDLTNILRQILDLILEDAIVEGDITDTVNEAFYLVDKKTGLPLEPWETIDIEGNKTTDRNKIAGTVQADGKTVKWNDQTIDNKNGWHGVVYVKAKEDLIGGNAVKTNDPNNPVEFLAEKYYTTKSTTRKPISSAASDSSKLKTRVLHENSPRVNVNELTFPNTETEWTVYLGTNVNPKTQIQKLYENIRVEEVVNENNSLHYPLSENDITDERESSVIGTAKTFLLAPVILEMIKADSTLRAKYIQNNALNWDAFLADIMKEGGVTVPYHPYGIEGEDSRIVISLTKEILSGEEADIVGRSPHNTTVVNATAIDEDENVVDVPVEKYVLTAKYYPDYDHVLPPGQGGTSTESFYTGTYGTGYQGHAAGTETSVNTHIVNVYAEPLDVLKHDDHDENVPGAEFKLYRLAKTGETGEPLSSYDSSLTGSYCCISTATSGEDGIAHLAPDDTTTPTHKIPIASGQTAQNLLVPGETYYLIETSAPSGYKKDETVRVVTVEAAPDLFTKLDKTTAVESANISGTPARPTILYNWNEGVTIKVTELGDATNTNKATLVNHETRQTITLGGGRTYMLRSDSDQSVVTQVIVINGKSVDIRIKKTDLNGTGLPNAVFQLQSVDGSAESDVSGVPELSTITKEVNGETKTFTSSFETTGGEQVFTGLSDGTYRLHEVYVPAGYISTFRYIQFTIDKGELKDVTTESGTSDKVIPTAATSNSLALLIIKNEPGAALPNTGGSGTSLIYFLGIILTCLAGAGLMMRKRCKTW